MYDRKENPVKEYGGMGTKTALQVIVIVLSAVAIITFFIG